jgi:hypothetical protein
MSPPPQILGAVCLGVAVALACSDGTAPVSGAGCGEEQQGGVVLEGDLRVARVYITREWTQVIIVSNEARTQHYRTCQSHTCWEAREDPAAALGDAEAAEALARCTAQADAVWASEHPA